MNHAETAQLLATMRGAWPNAKTNEETPVVWGQALSHVDNDDATAIIEAMIGTSLFHPSIAEFNTALIEHRRMSMRNAEADDRARFAIRCDGSGWLDKSSGLEPCPTCTPWARDRWERKLWHTPTRPPADYVMPQPCKKHETGRVVTREQGMAIACAAYVQACKEEGRTPTETALKNFELGKPRVFAKMPDIDNEVF